MTTPLASPSSRLSLGAFLRAASLLAAVGALGGCGRGGTHEITQVVERDDAGDPAPEATPTQRFRPRGDGSSDPHAGLSMPGRSGPTQGAPGRPESPGAADSTPSPFTWTAPPEWKRQGARSLRLATYVPNGAGKTEIAVSIFPGLVGGARANVDRWREQVGLGPVADAEFEALPRATLLGGAAVFLAVEGRYSGMVGAAGAEPTEGARLVAVAIERPKDVVFVKMTGPADEVRGEDARFRAFCESLRE